MMYSLTHSYQPGRAIPAKIKPKAQKTWRPLVGLSRQIAEECAREYGVSIKDLTGQSRVRYLAYARQDYMWRLRQIKRPNGVHRFSTPYIGSILGGRDHTTVVRGVKARARRMAEATAAREAAE